MTRSLSTEPKDTIDVGLYEEVWFFGQDRQLLRSGGGGGGAPSGGLPPQDDASRDAIT
jgi:hypothetical protein